MRLIDADKLIEELKECYDYDLQKELEFLEIYKFIKEQPTAYNVDKVVEQLEVLKEKAQKRREELYKKDIFNETQFTDINGYERGREYAFDDALDIVKAGGIDENNGC